MNNNPLISIVVPVYNVEFWLPKCIKSLLCQTYKNIEIILVDDGSKDKSPKICDDFSKKDKRIKVIHQKNQGVSTARNNGINLANGEYLCFVDSDDWLVPNAIESLYYAANTNGAQIVICDMLLISNIKSSPLFRLSQNKPIDIKNTNKITPAMLEDIFYGGAIGKLYKTSILKEHNITFPIDMKFAEDTYFHCECVKYCNKIAFIKDAIYIYNRLVYESAITRFYPEISEWMIRFAKIRFEALQIKDCNEQAAKEFLNNSYLKDLSFIVHFCALRSENSDISTLAYRKYFEYVKDYIQTPTNDTEKHIVEFCRNNDYDGLYNYAKQIVSINTTKSFKKYIKKVIKLIILKFRIIRYRYL